MQRRPLLHTRMLHQSSLCKEIRRQLHRATKARSDHRSANSTIQSPYALGTIDLSQAIKRVLVIMLRAHWQKGRIALQSRLDEEEGRTRSGANDTRRGTTEHVDGEVLGFAVLEKNLGESFAHGFVEAEAAAVEEDLVDVGAADTAVDAADALVADDDADAVDGPAVVVW